MKLDKDLLKKLIREAVEDPSIAGSRMDSREVYGDEESYDEGEGEEDEVIMELESIITSLIAVKKKLEGAQEKEGLKESAGGVSYANAINALGGCKEMIMKGQKKLALENLYILEKYITQ